MKFNGPEAQALTQAMARRGFVAAAVDYDNHAYPYCSGLLSKAKCIFNAQSPESAIAKVCAREHADCDAGIVVAGFSQGANLASLAKNYDPRVRAAYLLGLGNRPDNLLDMTACAGDSATVLLPGEMRAVNGEHDGFFGMTTEGVRKQLQRTLGATCADQTSCEQPGGGGWHIIRDADLKDGSADHCYFFHAANGVCSQYSGLDPNWQSGNAAWAMEASLDWLSRRNQGHRREREHSSGRRDRAQALALPRLTVTVYLSGFLKAPERLPRGWLAGREAAQGALVVAGDPGVTRGRHARAARF